jgi:hypothetical protein
VIRYMFPLFLFRCQNRSSIHYLSFFTKFSLIISTLFHILNFWMVWLWWCAGSYSRTNQDWIVIFTFQNWWWNLEINSRWNIEIQIANNKLWIQKLTFCEVSIP